MKFLFTSLALSCINVLTFAETITVDDDGKADYNNIQAAIDAASSSDEILVMPGTYTGSGNAVVNPNGTSIRVYSNDGPETTIIDGENARRGIECSSGETSGAIFEGFTITQGSLAGNVGGGLYCKNSSPMFVNCTFSNNTAGNDGEKNGGGAHCVNGAPTFITCRFISNIATRGGGVNTFKSAITFNECSFQENQASALGGGLYSYLTPASGEEVVLSLCIFEENTAQSGAGIYCNNANHIIDDCTFTSNIADTAGGGIYNNASSPQITNCNFMHNEAETDTGGGIRNISPSYPGIGDSYFCSNLHNGGNAGGDIWGDYDILGGNQFSEQCVVCTGDFDGNGTVDVNDVVNMIGAWGTDNAVYDIEVNGIVDVNDVMSLILNYWGPCE